MPEKTIADTIYYSKEAMSMALKGKVALVTGGSGGLGKVHGLCLAEAGCDVAVTGHSHLEKA